MLGIEFGIYTSNSYKGWGAGASGEGGLLEKVWRRRALEQVGSGGGELGTSGRKGGWIRAGGEEVGELEQVGRGWGSWHTWGGGQLCTCRCVWVSGPHFLPQCEWELSRSQDNLEGRDKGNMRPSLFPTTLDSLERNFCWREIVLPKSD